MLAAMCIIAIYVHMSQSMYEKATHMYTDVHKLMYSIVYRYTHNSCMDMLSNTLIELDN